VTTSQPRRVGRSILAIVAGLLVVVVLSLATDQLFHVLNVYPPWGQPMYDTGDNVLALSYRVVYTVLGYYVTARLAPYLPLRHMWILAGIGLVVGIAGAVSTIPMKLGPAWYPIAIAATALPCAWFAAAIYRARTAH
jgi:hypothetical protein